jgi:hypothetical protein
MVGPPLFETVPLQSADELLDALLPHRGEELWSGVGEEKGWIFRGQADAAWDLAPSVMRADLGAYQAGQVAKIKRKKLPMPERLNAELQLVVDFAALADREGFPLPGDTPEFRHHSITASTASNFPSWKFRGLFALAQHYGVPTRLLDWTRRPLVAAYFAAAETAERLLPYKTRRRHKRRKPKEIAVWALAQKGLGVLWTDEGGPDPIIEVLSAPAALVPNLRAQGGTFTLVCCRADDVARNDPPSIDRILKGQTLPERDDLGLGWAPILIKFVLPASEANRLLYLLSLLDIHAAALFPGLAGVEQRMFERCLYRMPAFVDDD